jgi:CxxC motif-containing protein (DUF1111 family)
MARIVASALLVAACSGEQAASTSAPTIDDLTRSGGAATVTGNVNNAFGQSLPGLDREQRRAFNVGNNFFNDNWVTAPASTGGRDGLGPVFNAQSCSSCHEFDGRAAPPQSADDPRRGLLIRLSVAGADGVMPDPVYGDQLQDRAINGVAAEGSIVITTDEIQGVYADGTPYTLQRPEYAIADLGYGPLADGVMLSPRIAPAVFGVGLLEAVPDEAIRASADPDDADGDGISGRVNVALDPDGNEVVGRFGWKASVATVEQQNAAAFHGDIGITTPLRPEVVCSAAQTQCAAAPDGGNPEVDAQKLGRVTFYTRSLAVPARRDAGSADTAAGEQTFSELGCASCHSPAMTTGESELADLANQSIRPYTDLLLHDMGDGLADGRPDGQATGSEWRTAPLWGIGLVDDVNGHTRFLHDGRARSLEEAILWHGGEAESAQRGFVALPADERRQLLMFLESL